ncbi:MAG: MFS transporter [Patescibacteria group bacterium]
MKDFKLVLKNTKFIYLWSSQILSQLTINIMNFLLLIRIFEYTQSSIATSFLWIAYALPAIIIGPIAAASVDMLDRRRVLMVTNFLQSATILLYAFVHESRLFLPYGVASMYSFLNQFYVPAESASLPSVVRKPSLPQANGLFFLTQQAALIIGFGFAGLLNHVLGFENSLFLCSGLLFLAFIVVSFLPRMRTRHSVPKSLDRAVFKFFKRIMEGYSFIRENHSILLPFILMMGLSVALSIVVVSLPVMAEEIFRIDINSAGVIVIVPAGIGAAFGTLTITRLLKRGWRKKRAIELFFTIIAAVLLVFTFLLPELPSTARLATGIIGVFLLGPGFWQPS